MTTSLRSLLFGLAATVSLIASARAELSDSDRTLYREAYEAAKADQWDQVWTLTRGAGDQFPAQLLLWIEMMRNGPEVRFDQIRDFLVRHPTWPGQMALRRHAEQLLREQSDAVAIAWFQEFPPVSPAGLTRRADLLIAGGHQAEGTALIREVWIDANFSQPDEIAFLLHHADKLHPADDARRLDRLLWDGKDAQARRMLARVGLDQRTLGLARIALQTMAPNAEHLVAEVPGSLQNDPGLLFARLKWRRRKEHYDDAIALLDHPPANLVRPLAWAGERQILARKALAGGDAALAYRLAARNGLIEGPAFGELEFFAGWVALRYLHDPVTASTHFIRLYDHSKMAVSRSRGAYWAARAAEVEHRNSDAADWYVKATLHPTTYYGQLAAAARHQTGPIHIAPEPVPDRTAIVTFEQQELVRAARDLVAMGDSDDARPFLFQLAETASKPGDLVQVARLSMALDRPDMALMTAKRAANEGVTLFTESYPLVPLPPGGTAEAALVLAVTRQESAFDVEAISSVGARGMMQLMPATAQKMAKELDLPFSTSLLTQDRVYNMRLGRAYLDEMLTQFNGSYVLAIAAYNAGPARVNQWIGQLGDPRAKSADVIDWVESIPIGETRNYVQRVLENVQVYRLLLGNRDHAFELAADLRR